jgi:hypothetical protein
MLTVVSRSRSASRVGHTPSRSARIVITEVPGNRNGFSMFSSRNVPE